MGHQTKSPGADPSAYPLGSVHSRAEARRLLMLRRFHPPTPEEIKQWYEIKNAHKRMRELGSPCCDEKKCYRCKCDAPPAMFPNVSLDNLAEQIRKHRAEANKRADIEYALSKAGGPIQ